MKITKTNTAHSNKYMLYIIYSQVVYYIMAYRYDIEYIEKPKTFPKTHSSRAGRKYCLNAYWIDKLAILF